MHTLTRLENSPVAASRAGVGASVATRSANVASLSSLAREVEVEERVAEFEVVRAAFLIDRFAVEDVEAQAEELAQRHDGLIRFKLTGPLPPHHFVSERWAS